MNRSLLSAALLLSFAAPAAFAQAAPAPVQEQHQRAHNPHRAAVHMAKKLNLSPDQTAKVEPILADRRAKMKALKADTTLTPDQKKAQRKEIQHTTHDSLAGVLTPEQMANLKQMHHDHKHTAANNSVVADLSIPARGVEAMSGVAARLQHKRTSPDTRNPQHSPVNLSLWIS